MDLMKPEKDTVDFFKENVILKIDFFKCLNKIMETCDKIILYKASPSRKNIEIW